MPTKLSSLRFGLIRLATILFAIRLTMVYCAGVSIETAWMRPVSSTRRHQCNGLCMRTTKSTPHKPHDDVIRSHTGDTFGSCKNNVRREQQGRDTKKTGHFDSQEGEICWRNRPPSVCILYLARNFPVHGIGHSYRLGYLIPHIYFP
ncbi:hypothetical protein SCLCIDRAFT_1102321 [Scleroderma citrinum Foug A]|uniref:Uncharacterized protein n=1 Tax=Scleroderma citrinum Foug A TaxID=1036808 RepID=A0A0C2Z7P0_9AGAM|nr:hypothetical protein SCLCIDRAFT_1102321 [Scleroderma citrinum Foug A]